MQSSRVHGLEFSAVEMGKPYAAEGLLSIVVRDDGEIELSRDQHLITAVPLRMGWNGLRQKRQDPIEITNIIAYANRAALLELTLGAVAFATHQSDDLMMAETANIQKRWADVYERTSGNDHAVFNDREYVPGLEFGPLATPITPNEG
jgi:hypothetical protein